MADKFAKSNPYRTPAAAARRSPSFLIALSSLFIAVALALAAAACSGRPVPTPAPTPTPAKPTETPASTVDTPAPTPTPAHAPATAPSPSWKTLESLGAMSQITIGDGSICGLSSEGVEGNVICVGWHNVKWGDSGAFTLIESGKEFSCGLRIDRKIICRGLNIYGETEPPDGEFTAIAAGKRHACALDAAGKAVCWGWNRHGRADPPPDATFAAIAAGDRHACGIAEFGNLVCWGSDSQGESAPREGPFSALALGNGHTCALRTSGEVFCQGDDSRGQSSPPDSILFDQISAGDRQTCGLARGGAIECWGAFPVSKHAGDFVSVNVGYAATCARRADGYAECLDYAASLETVQDEFPIFGGAEFEQPIEMFPWPLGGLAIVERRGYVQIRPDAKSDADGEPHIALDLSDRVYCCLPELGMLGAAIDPDFDNFPFIYIYYQIDAKNLTPGADSFFGRLSRFPVLDDGKGGRIDADDELVIIELPQSGFHVGGGIRFGPDGMLYASLGEGGECEVEKRCIDAQDLRTLSGKIIRLDVRGATEAEPYRVPPDNPFADAPDARPEIWASGMRNPFRISFDREGSLIVADVGGFYFEELSIAAAGADLGYPRYEANLCNSLSAALCAEIAGYAMPIHIYNHLHGNCAIIGGANLPGPGGEYVFGDYCSGRVWALEGGARTGYYARELADLYRPITAFGTDADGAIYALTQNGPIIPITP